MTTIDGITWPEGYEPTPLNADRPNWWINADPHATSATRLWSVIQNDDEGQRIIALNCYQADAMAIVDAFRFRQLCIAEQAGPTAEVDRLAQWIIANVPGEPSRSEGAVDVAIRLIGGRFPQAGVPLDQTSPNLIRDLNELCDKYGPRGVAETLEQLHPGAHPAPAVGSFPARSSDPGTSDLAASRHSTTDVGRFTDKSLQARMLREIARRPNTAYLAAVQCVPTDAFNDARKWMQRVETARKRASDLLRAGYVADSGRTRENPGADTPSVVLEVTPAGRIAIVKLDADGVSK